MTRRLLVTSDNHGDTESLRRVLDDTDGESFDVAVHVVTTSIREWSIG